MEPLVIVGFLVCYFASWRIWDAIKSVAEIKQAKDDEGVVIVFVVLAAFLSLLLVVFSK